MIRKGLSLVVMSLSIVINLYSQNMISGKVVNNLTNEKVSFPSISLADSSGMSFNKTGDEYGNFMFENIPDGEYILTVSEIGFESKIIPVSIKSSENNILNVDLEPKLYDIEEVQVKSLKQDISVKKSPMPVTLVTGESIKKESPNTLSDLLNNEAGVSLYRDGIWATSVNIRGLSEQRIVALIDGNRIETATDLAAGLSLVDLNDIERVEIVKGALSSIYGTGAMGGIINIYTKNGFYNDTFYAQGKVGSMYHTVNNLYGTNAKLYLGDKNWYTSIGGSFKKADDIKTPEGTIKNSQYSDDNLSFNAGIKPFRNHEFITSFQRFTAHDVGIPGGSAFPPLATATYPIEKRILFSSEYKIKNISNSFQNVSFKYFNQYILRDVINVPNIPASRTELKPDSIQSTHVEKITPTGKHKTQGIQVQTDWQFVKNISSIIGVDAWQRDLKTEREKYIITEISDSSGNVFSTRETVRSEVPIPNSVFRSVGLYFQEKYNPGEKITFILGGRFDFINVTNEQAVDPLYLRVNGILNANPPNQRITFESKNKNDISWSTNLGFQYEVFKDFYSSISFGRAFRSPSLEERFKYIDLGSMVRIGDPELEPERGYLFDMGIKLYKPQLHFTLNGYLNIMNNLIVEKSGIYIYNTVNNTDLFDTIPALINSNVNEARLCGFDLTYKYNIYKNFIITGNAAYTIGKDLTANDNLPLIPPFNGLTEIEYSVPKIVSAGIECVYFAKQNKAAKDETNTNGYVVFNIKVNSAVIHLYQFDLELSGGINNLLDKAYTNHLSSNRGDITIEPGRNTYVKIIASF